MFFLSSDALMLASEPAVLCKNGSVVFANGSARKILGSDCVGKRSESCFGSEISGVQSSSFIADISIHGKHYILRVSKSEGLEAVFFSPQDEIPLMIDSALLCSLRSYLMNINISLDMARERAETLGDAQSLDSLASLTRSYYGVCRLGNNATAVQQINIDALHFAPEPVNLSEQCRSFLEPLGWMFPAVTFKASIDREVDLLVDPALFRLLVENLVSNCLRHAKGLTRVAISLTEIKGSVILSVSDDGCGIPQSELYSVFDLYHYGFDMSHVGSGAGLGLTVARGIAAIHGGTLLLESREGHGTTVRVSFRKDSFIPLNVRTNQDNYRVKLESLIIGMSSCLPTEFFKQKFAGKK